MGQGTRSVELAEQPPGDAPRSSEEAVRRLSAEVVDVREELGGLLMELDRRRHEVLDVKRYLWRHAFGVAAGAVSVIGAAAGVRAWRTRAGRKPPLAEAVVNDGPRVRATGAPSMVGSILRSTAAAALTPLVNRLLDRGIDELVARYAPSTRGGGRSESVKHGEHAGRTPRQC
jgi:hypothetical protein